MRLFSISVIRQSPLSCFVWIFFVIISFSFPRYVKAADPIGWIEPASCSTQNGSGWTCDPDNFNSNLQVLIYDGQRENGGYPIAQPIANISRSDTSSVCGGNLQHGFLYQVPRNILDGSTHSLYAYARDATSQTLVQLNGNPLTINCAPQATVMTLSATPVTITSGESSILTWSSNADICYIKDATARPNSGSLQVSPTVTTKYSGTCYVVDRFGLLTSPSETIQVTVTVTGGAISGICTGSTPLHASMWPGDEPPSSDLTKLYSETNTTRQCEFHCDSGYIWNGGACTTPPGNTPKPNPDLKIAGSDGPVTMSQGSTYALAWTTVSNATSCTGTGPGWDGSKAPGGGLDDLSAIMTSGTYTLTCTGPGGTASDSIVVNVQTSGGGTPSGLPDFQAYGNLGSYKTVRVNTPVDIVAIFGDEMGVGTKQNLEVKFRASRTDQGASIPWTDIGITTIGPLTGKQKLSATLTTSFSQIGELFLQVCIDPRNVISEISEHNNCTGGHWSVVDENGNGVIPGSPGSACTGDVTKSSGICSTYCGNARSEASNICVGGTTCCIGTENNAGERCTGSLGTGICQLSASCSGVGTVVSTCTGGTLCCQPATSTGGGTPPPSCPTYTGAINTVTGNTTYNVFGSGPFTSSTDTGAAAVFLGLIKPGEPARLSVDAIGLVNSFTGSTRNGITSQSYGADCGINISIYNYYCSGTLPTNSVWWTAADYNLQQAGISWQYASADTSRACEFHCSTGFTWSGSACMQDASSPAPNTCASQGGTGCAAICSGASVTASDCTGSKNLCCKSAPPVPGCTPSSACAANTCVGSTCSDGCGSTVSGTKTCSGTGFSLFGSGYENPLESSDLCALTTTLLTGLQGIVVTLAIVFIIIGALIYLTSAGDESRITWAKKAILAAVLGLALAVAAPMFLREIGTIMGWSSFGCSGAPINYGTSLTLTQTLGNILSFLLALVGVVALIMLIIGAFLYITAGGETDRADTGKKIVKFAVLGIIVTLAGLVIIRQVAGFFV